MAPPAVTVWDAGVALRLKSGGSTDAETARVTLVEWLRLPLTPVTVRVEFPAGVALVVFTDIVDEPPLMAEKLPPAPEGKPLTFNDTEPLKPLVPVTPIA